jgi:hypothetical protein
MVKDVESESCLLSLRWLVVKRAGEVHQKFVRAGERLFRVAGVNIHRVVPASRECGNST